MKVQRHACTRPVHPAGIWCASLPERRWWALHAQVLGCAKGVVASVVSIMVFQNPVTVLGAAGYCLTVLGVFAYGWTKKHM